MPEGATTFTAEAFAVEDGTAFRRRVEALRRQAPWDKLDEADRRAFVMLVRDALLLLADDPAQWLPAHMTTTATPHLALLVDFLFDHVDTQVTELRATAVASEAERRDRLGTILEELHDARPTAG